MSARPAKSRKASKLLKKTPKVALLNNLGGEYGTALLRGILQYANLHGPWSFHGSLGLLGHSSQELKAQVKTKSWLKNSKIDGLIVREWRVEEEDIRRFIPDGFPLIMVPGDEFVPGYTNVIPDSFAIGKMAAEYLLKHGFTEFAYCDLSPCKISCDRGEGFEKTISDSGFECFKYKYHDSLQGNIIYFTEKHRADLTQWLMSLPKPIGMLAYNDINAVYIIETCRMADIRVPDEIAILGVDNDELICKQSNPSISSVAINVERAGYEAAEQLAKMMAGEKTSNKTIFINPTHVETRQSTDILAIEDKDVVKAIRFINENCKHPIQVSDIVNATTLSRTVLYERFHKATGMTIKNYTWRAHTDYIAKLLVETNLPISQITSSIGYSSDKHIARHFREIKGMSFMAYRKKFGKI